MKRLINKEELRREWILEHWWEKGVYVVGIVMTVYLFAAFMIGFIGEMLAL